ncbi:hypothetical protein CRENBAI_025499 [Crenichthys baileyi]|uniref:Uncharacterized protein n=1 Tax=Crenichthys baileyi TaxID=28760 RepID=A0AAV9S914_9TELE
MERIGRWKGVMKRSPPLPTPKPHDGAAAQSPHVPKQCTGFAETHARLQGAVKSSPRQVFRALLRSPPRSPKACSEHPLRFLRRCRAAHFRSPPDNHSPTTTACIKSPQPPSNAAEDSKRGASVNTGLTTPQPLCPPLRVRGRLASAHALRGSETARLLLKALRSRGRFRSAHATEGGWLAQKKGPPMRVPATPQPPVTPLRVSPASQGSTLNRIDVGEDGVDLMFAGYERIRQN